MQGFKENRIILYRFSYGSSVVHEFPSVVHEFPSVVNEFPDKTPAGGWTRSDSMGKIA